MIKINGSYVSGATQFKLSGAYTAVTQYIKSGGVYSSIGAQTLVPFTIGNLSFAVASIDSFTYEGGGTVYAERQMASKGIITKVYNDGLGGTTVDTWLNTRVPLLISSHSGQAAWVTVLNNPLGNDITNAFNSYGAVNLSPDSIWITALDKLDRGIKKLQAAGSLVIIGNNSYRNYGVDNRCRTNEDLGSKYINDKFLHPYIKDNFPGCWNFSHDVPFLDNYTYSWNIADWMLIDMTHPTSPGKSAWRRFNSEIISKMSAGIVPQFMEKKPWPLSSSNTNDLPSNVVVAFGSDSAAPPNVNKLTRLAVSTTKVDTLFKEPLLYVDVNGVARALTVNVYGATNTNTTGRGNAGDVSSSITNNVLLKQFAYITTSGTNFTGPLFVEIGGLTPYGEYTIAINTSASYTATAGDKVTALRANTKTAVNHISDEALPINYVTITTAADSMGYVYVTADEAPGSAFAYINCLQIKSV